MLSSTLNRTLPTLLLLYAFLPPILSDFLLRERFNHEILVMRQCHGYTRIFCLPRPCSIKVTSKFVLFKQRTDITDVFLIAEKTEHVMIDHPDGSTLYFAHVYASIHKVANGHLNLRYCTRSVFFKHKPLNQSWFNAGPMSQFNYPENTLPGGGGREG